MGGGFPPHRISMKFAYSILCKPEACGKLAGGNHPRSTSHYPAAPEGRGNHLYALSQPRRGDIFVENPSTRDSKLRRSGIVRWHAEDAAPTELNNLLSVPATKMSPLRGYGAHPTEGGFAQSPAQNGNLNPTKSKLIQVNPTRGGTSPGGDETAFLAPLQGAEVFAGHFRGYHPLTRVQPPANFRQPFGLAQALPARTWQLFGCECGGI
jgi:hypothetical protein